jgi:hypothetical protein
MQYHTSNSFFVFPDFSPLYRELHQSQDGLGKSSRYLYLVRKRQCCESGTGGSVINWPPGSGSKHFESRIWIRFRIRIPTIYQRLLKNLRKNGVQYFFNYNDLQHVMTTNVFSLGTKMSR